MTPMLLTFHADGIGSPVDVICNLVEFRRWPRASNLGSHPGRWETWLGLSRNSMISQYDFDWHCPSITATVRESLYLRPVRPARSA